MKKGLNVTGLGFKEAFKATLGYYAAMLLITVVGLSVAGLAIYILS
jgi:hypothetical protein